jgi:hypothetical protein
MALVAREPKRAVKRVIYENATMMKFEALRELEKKQESSTTSAREEWQGEKRVSETSGVESIPARSKPPEKSISWSLYVVPYRSKRRHARSHRNGREKIMIITDNLSAASRADQSRLAALSD